MVDRKGFAPLCLALASCGLLGCGSEAQVLLLDRICNPDVPLATSQPNCTVAGDADLTTGVTGDTTAVRFGPSTGELYVRLGAIQAASQAVWSLDVLAASSRSEGSTLYRSLSWGTCGSDCPSDPDDVEAPLSDEFQWAAMVTDLAGSFSAPSTLDAFLVLRGADIDIIDLRTPGFDSYYY